jgi:YD repeat-containing protein
MSEITNAGTEITDYVYDSKKRLITITDPGNMITTNTYDDADRLIKTVATYIFQGTTNDQITNTTYQDAHSAKTTNIKTYASDGSLISNTTTIYLLGGGSAKQITARQDSSYLEAYDAKGVLVGTAYEVSIFNDGLLKEDWHSTGPADTFTYDANGNLLSEKHSSYTSVYTYTDKKNLAAVAFSALGYTQTPYLVASTNVQSTYSSSTIYDTYTFNAKGYVASISETQSSAPGIIDNVIRYEYDNDGYITSTTFEYPSQPGETIKYLYTYIEQ